MNKDRFHNILDELAEVWYIDAGKKILGIGEDINAGKTRAKRFEKISTSQMLKIIETSESNLSGYPVVERWKHEYKPEIIRLPSKEINIV